MGKDSNLSRYQSKAQKAEDEKGSALALLIVGLSGLVISLLWAFNLLPGNMSIVRRFIVCGILGILSIVMLIMSYFSMKNSKQLMKGAKAEDKRTEEIMKWAREHLDAAGLDNGMISPDTSMAEEEKCLLRMRRISYELDHKFMNLDPAYIDEISERIYQMIYEDDDAGAIAS